MTSESILNELSKIDEFEEVKSNNKSIIKLSGKIDFINIYVNPLLNNEIYIGKFDSISSIFNKNIKIEDCPHGVYEEGIKITAEYIFLHKNNIRRILVK